jgi:signal transduction histidine kinase
LVAQVNLLRLYLLLGAIFSLAGALAASWVVAGRALAPLDTMTETVEAIGSAQDLARRLPDAPARDEVGRLTGAFNAMMGRLDEAYSRLEGALESQRRFVADASHELRTPLTSIRSNLGLLLGRTDIAAADRAEALQDMEAEAQRMTRLVADLLTLARADAGQSLEMADVEITRLAEEVARQARRTYPGRRLDFDRRRPTRVRGNADSLRQLLWILLDNAARHTDPGSRIKLIVDAGPEAARLTVTDDGPGIAPGDLERVFERFYRADQARSSGGAGLGLSIARWIVKQHGGRIQAGANPDGRGASFTVELPVASTDEVRNVA